MWFFLLGLLIGSTIVIGFFRKGVSTHWATFAGAGAGAIITVLGIAWLDAFRREREDAGRYLRMTPDLIVLRGELRAGSHLLKHKNQGAKLPLSHIYNKIDKAYASWQKIIPRLEDFPDTAIDSYRLKEAFRELKGTRKDCISEENFRRTLSLATKLASRFKVDEVDLE